MEELKLGGNFPEYPLLYNFDFWNKFYTYICVLRVYTHTHTHVYIHTHTYIYFNIYLFLRESMEKRVGEGQREGDRGSKAGSIL